MAVHLNSLTNSEWAKTPTATPEEVHSSYISHACHKYAFNQSGLDERKLLLKETIENYHSYDSANMLKKMLWSKETKFLLFGLLENILIAGTPKDLQL